MANKKNEIIIYTVIIIVIISGSLWMALRLNARIKQGDSRINTLQKQVTVAKKKIRSLPQIRAEALLSKELEKAYIEFVPNRKGQAQFVKELAELAQEYKLAISSCRIADHPIVLKNPLGYVIYQWRVALLGGYEDFLHFLQACADFKRFVRVSDLKIRQTAPGSEGETPASALSIDLTLDLVTKPNREGD